MNNDKDIALFKEGDLVLCVGRLVYITEVEYKARFNSFYYTFLDYGTSYRKRIRPFENGAMTAYFIKEGFKIVNDKLSKLLYR